LQSATTHTAKALRRNSLTAEDAKDAKDAEEGQKRIKGIR
jgi:hypothetical protein